MDENTTGGAGKSSLGDVLGGLLDRGQQIYTTQTNANTAKRTAGASFMESSAAILKSKYTLIGIGVVVVGAVLLVIFRRK